MAIEDILAQFSENIKEHSLTALAYHQLTPLSMMDEHDCGISFAAKTNPASKAFNDFDRLAVAYYKRNFPHLHPFTCRLDKDRDIETALSNGKTMSLRAALPEQHNILLIPTFSPLNCVGIFTLQIEPRHIDPSPVNLTNIVGRVSMLAQACHVDICQAQSETSPIHLTDREREILQWVARGKSNSVIAQILGISAHTVTGYLRNIYLKTETNDRTSAAIFAMQQGLLHITTASNNDAALDVAS